MTEISAILLAIMVISGLALVRLFTGFRIGGTGHENSGTTIINSYVWFQLYKVAGLVFLISGFLFLCEINGI